MVIGYGNPGRQDDGLGPAVAAAFEQADLPDVTVDSDYQLTVEDAAAVAQHDVVIFADADCTGPEPFRFDPVLPGDAVTFSSHSVQPDGVLALADQLFGVRPRAYALGIRGYEFNEYREALSAAAQRNLAAAVDFLRGALNQRTVLRDGSPHELAALAGASTTANGDE